eukprot:546171-Ditylum_brightwellii.AAC.1
MVDLSAKLKDQYLETKEMIDDKIPKPLFGELAIIAYIDSDHVYDKMTGRSITSFIIVVGRALVIYQSKCQGVLEIFTYGVEFMVMKAAIEE